MIQFLSKDISTFVLIPSWEKKNWIPLHTSQTLRKKTEKALIQHAEH